MAEPYYGKEPLCEILPSMLTLSLRQQHFSAVSVCLQQVALEGNVTHIWVWHRQLYKTKMMRQLIYTVELGQSGLLSHTCLSDIFKKKKKKGDVKCHTAWQYSHFSAISRAWCKSEQAVVPSSCQNLIVGGWDMVEECSCIRANSLYTNLGLREELLILGPYYSGQLSWFYPPTTWLYPEMEEILYPCLHFFEIECIKEMGLRWKTALR